MAREVGPGQYARVREAMEALRVDAATSRQLEFDFSDEPTQVIQKPDNNPITPSKDLKAGVGGKKPQLSHMPAAALTWAARAFQYGSQKYARGNYLRPQVDKLADFERLGAYLDACLRHIFAVTTEMEWMRGNTPLNEGYQFLIGGYPDGESKLPHLAHALCSLMMAIQQGADSGILCLDPGTPWETE